MYKVLYKILQGRDDHNSAAPRRTTALKVATRTAVPIRRNVSSSLKTQDVDSLSLYDEPSAVYSKQQREQSHTWSSPRFNVLNSMHTTQSMFQLVFQLCNASPGRCTDSSHKSTMRRRHSQNCDEIQRADGNNAPNTLKRTGSYVPLERPNCSVTLLPLVKSPRFLATIHRRLTPLTIPTTGGIAGHNHALALKPVVARIAAGPLL